jgi:hypothetical protein
MTRLNAAKGNPVRIVPPVQPQDMQAEYKRHEWLVYTASREMNSVGWPMSVAEAQAAGVGVCLPNIRPDLRDYVGEAGFLYNSIAEVAEYIRQPLSDEMRDRGFEQAKKSDIFEHKKILTDLWRKAKGTQHGWRTGVASGDNAVPWGEGETTLEKRHRLQLADQELAHVVASCQTVILVDEGALGTEVTSHGHVLRFLERDGQYWGPPGDDSAAIAELEKMRQAGAGYLAFAWPAFWWLDYYGGFHRHLREHCRCVLKNNRLVVFDLSAV